MTPGTKKKHGRQKGKQGSSSSAPAIQDAAPPLDGTRDPRRPPDTQEARSSPASSASIPSIPQRATPPSAGTTSLVRLDPQHSSTRSFAAVVKAGRTSPAGTVVPLKPIDILADRGRAPDDVLAEKFRKFLKEYVEPGGKFGIYRAQVLSMRIRRCYMLEVNFHHLRRCMCVDSDYTDLVLRIGNDTDSEHKWLRPVIRQFLKDEEFHGEEEEINIKAKVSFLHRPRSIRMLKDFLEDQIPLTKDISVLAGSRTVYATTTRGRQAFSSVLKFLLSRHRKDKFYNGHFDIENLVIVNSHLCLILKKSQSMPSMSTPEGHISVAQAKLSDLKKLWTTMEKYYIKGKVLPLYFEELKADLTRARESEIKEAWFPDYLLSHPALMPSMSRKHLVEDLHIAVKSFKLGKNHKFDAILSERPNLKDWTSVISNSGDPILSGVYQHMFDADDKTVKACYENTIEGLLKYIRHLLQHAIDHIEKAKKANDNGKDKKKDDDLSDLDEIELFAAASFPKFLPNLLKCLLRQDKMRGKLAGPWSNYRSTKSDMKDLPFK